MINRMLLVWFMCCIAAPAIKGHGRSAVKYEYDPTGNKHDTAEDENVHIQLNDQAFCAGTMCFSQEECCKGTACIRHSSSGGRGAEMGLCAKLVSQPEGKLCLMGAKNSCTGDMTCRTLHHDFYPIGMCNNNNSILKKKKYFESCSITLDCDFEQERLCCRSQTPGHLKERRICSYYDAPLDDCIF